MQAEYSEIPGHCQRPTLRGFLYNRSQRLFMRCPCGSWACAGCGKYKARCVARRFAAMGATHLMTVTLAGQPDEHRAKVGMRALRRWMRRHGLVEASGWVREYGEKGGRLHFHALVRSRLSFWPWSLLQKAARRCGLGNLDIRRVEHSKAASHYVAKYLAKDMEHSHGKGRRYYCPIKPVKSGVWEWHPVDWRRSETATTVAVQNRTMFDLPPAPPRQGLVRVRWEDGVLVLPESG